MPGHVGIAYQASNARYLGRASSKTLHLAPSGVALSTRAVSKVRLQEHGAESAEKRLVRLGAPPRTFGQHPADWINGVLAGNTFRRVRHPGNHIYAWALGTRRAKVALVEAFAPALAFPKTLDGKQTEFSFGGNDGTNDAMASEIPDIFLEAAVTPTSRNQLRRHIT